VTTVIKHSKHLVVELEDKAEKIFQKAIFKIKDVGAPG